MAEYIEREDVEKFIEKGLNNPDKSNAYGFDAVEILAEVHFMPAADVAEVKHGKWIYIPHYNGFYDDAYMCNVCKEISLEKGNYCPNCGARMDGEGE